MHVGRVREVEEQEKQHLMNKASNVRTTMTMQKRKGPETQTLERVCVTTLKGS